MARNPLATPDAPKPPLRKLVFAQHLVGLIASNGPVFTDSARVVGYSEVVPTLASYSQLAALSKIDWVSTPTSPRWMDTQRSAASMGMSRIDAEFQHRKAIH